MERVSRDEVLMGMAAVIAARGTCDKLMVGVVFSREGRVISTGYNGAPAGLPHCEHFTLPNTLSHEDTPTWVIEAILESQGEAVPGARLSRTRTGVVWQPPGTSGGCPTAAHAEQNGIAFAARHGVVLQHAEMHITHMPCLSCSRSIINAGISRVVFAFPYRKLEGVELLAAVGIEVVHFSPTL